MAVISMVLPLCLSGSLFIVFVWVSVTPVITGTVLSKQTLIIIPNISYQLVLTKQQNDFKIELTRLENDLLLRLSAAEGSFLDDTALVERLETTKATAAEIEHKVGAAGNSSQVRCSAG